jgi:hypothetical protein
MIYLEAAARRVYSNLSGSASLVAIVGSRIYQDIAPQGADFPYLVFSFPVVTDTTFIGATSADQGQGHQSVDLMLRVYDNRPNDKSRIYSALEAADTAVCQGGASNQYHAYRPVRNQAIDVTVTENGVTYHGVALSYFFWIFKTPQ